MVWPVKTTTAIIVEWFLIGIAMSFVSLRILMRNVYRGSSLFALSPSDGIIIATLLCSTTNVVADTVLYIAGFKDPRLSLDMSKSDPFSAFDLLSPKVMTNLFKLLYASLATFCFSLWGVKIYLIVLYYQIISPVTMPRQRFALHIITGIVASTGITGLGITMFWCSPISRNWTFNDPGIFSLPFFFLHVLRRHNKKQFYAATAMFSIGFLGILISIGRMVYIFHSFPSPVISMINVWARLEQCIGIIVCCLPAFKNLVLRRRSSNGNSTSSQNLTAGSGSRSSQAGSSKRRSVGPSEMSESSPVEGRGRVIDPTLGIMRVDTFERDMIERPKSIVSLFGKGSLALGAQIPIQKL
ncbi:hypothetical protein H072_10317 [Dactylellina haptotyla CBS 200.50]|uniref:Rhodopsin domain-containing protein n=1 Tax=Dactylellina haptotyla (strain CBS 200.50) TaxID=1284197 RepID=S8BLK4_DACHA|nr:hypothetical protein H072_10317 [Dactylellina haptotyla CBS 200.50]